MLGGVMFRRLFYLSGVFLCVTVYGAHCAYAQTDWKSLDQEAETAFNGGDLDSAETKWSEALKLADSQRAVEPGVVTCLCKLALVNDKRHRYEEAERLYELAMRNMEGLAGPNSTRFADWMPDLAWMYQAHGRSDKSEVLFKRALRIKETAYGADDDRVAQVLDDYARFLRKENRSTEASVLEQRARVIRSKATQ